MLHISQVIKMDDIKILCEIKEKKIYDGQTTIKGKKREKIAC